jgi:alpha-mannosidase
VYDKQRGREVLDDSGKGNLIQIVEDFGDSEGFLRSADGAYEHNIWDGTTWDLDTADEIAVVERGPVRAVVQVKKKYGLARFIQRVILYSKIRRVDFELVLDWDGKDKMVKVSFPLSVSSPEATYEIPYGTIARPSIGEEHVAQKWVDVSDGDYGVSLLNDSRHGHDIRENVIRLSVLRSPTGPAYATDEEGVHEVGYSLYPHGGSWQEGDVMRRGYEFNYPLRAVVTTAHDGNLPPSYSFLQIEPENLIVSVLKRAEDSDDLILRFYETEGQACTGRIMLSEPLQVDAVHKVDLLEHGLEEVPTDGLRFVAEVGPYSIESFKLIKDMF